MKRLFALGLLIAAGTLSVSGQDTMIFGDLRPDAPALAARGDYNVGVRTLTLTHTDQVDIVNAANGQEAPVYDRTLTVEVWYPAAISETPVITYDETLGRVDDPNAPLVPFTFQGRAARDAEIDTQETGDTPYPLIVVSHGWPGSRYMMTYLTENLASKGYVVAAIDHTESTFSDVNGFSSTLLNRPLDIRFVIDEFETMTAKDSGSFFEGAVDAENVGLIGYSMGGYGVLNVAGGAYGSAYIPTLSQFGFAGVDLLEVNVAGNEAYTPDERVKAVYTFAPWGMNFNLWDKDSLSTLDVPVFFVGGSQDDVSGYENGPHKIFDLAVNADRYFLTFENARHNVAPNPPPANVTYDQFMRYADNVWESGRMNNINQHFATAFFEKYLKDTPDSANYDQYLDLIEVGAEGVYALNPDGSPKADHTYWEGFQPRSAVGLRLEHLTPEE